MIIRLRAGWKGVPSLRATVRSFSCSVGLVGLPNVGKSTLFNGLVRQSLAQASNYPFTTIEPNIASVEVVDPRIDQLARLSRSSRKLSWQIDVHDIAGLIKGASKGEGLGNAFLGNIRATSAILHVVRCFADGDVIHVHDSPDPVRDVQILESELLLADLQSCEKRLGGGGGKASRTAEGLLQQGLLRRAQEAMENGLPASVLEPSLSREEAAHWPRLSLLTQKKMVYVLNVGEDDLMRGGNDMTKAVNDFLANRAATTVAPAAAGAAPAAGAIPADGTAAAAAATAQAVIVCAKLEAEAAVLSDADRSEFLAAYGLQRTGMDAVVATACRILGLQSYFTTGPMDTRAWCIPVGATAVEAAGVIHTDLAAGFVRAEVTSFDDYMAAGGDARKRSEGKAYVVRDGDVCNFLVANSTSGKSR